MRGMELPAGDPAKHAGQGWNRPSMQQDIASKAAPRRRENGPAGGGACGGLTLISAAERRYCELLLQGFATQNPDVELDFVFGISTDLYRRYLQEASADGPTADLFWSSAMDQQMALVLDG